MSQFRQNKEVLDKTAGGAGFLSGALIPLGISVEESILSPFLGGLKGFELIVLIATIVLFLAIIMQLVILRGKLFGLSIFSTSFFGGLLIFFQINPVNYITLFIGLAFLIISMFIAKYS